MLSVITYRVFELATQSAEPASLDPMVVLILTVLILGIAVIFVVHTRMKIARRNAERGTPREQIDAIKQRAEGEQDVNRSMSEMLGTARRLAAQLDNKAERLEQLLHEADGHIERLSGMRRQREHGPDESGEVPPRGGNGAASPRARSHGPAAADSEAAAADAENLSRFDASAPTALHAEIHRLADKGYTPVEIAQRLNEQTGKVELILALRDRKG